MINAFALMKLKMTAGMHPVGLLGGALCAALLAAPVKAQDAAALRARHTALSQQLASNSFGRPLHVESSEDSGRQQGNIYATLEHPFGTASPALGRMENWCDILILPVNVKYCAASSAAVDALTVFISRKPHDPLDSAYRVNFSFEVAAAGADYLRVTLSSPTGPLGTTDYRIGLEAAPLDTQRTFVHMSYSYGLGIAARIAMRAYLATSGRDKVGFSIVERLPDGRPVYIGGLRGVVERNAMRYHLAVEAYLGSLDAPLSQQLNRRLLDWFAAIGRYPAQLREELTRAEYLEMKRKEIDRQRADGVAS